MKNRKLNLNSIKVKSFVTNLESENSETINGGVSADWAVTTWNVHTLAMAGCNGTLQSILLPRCNMQ